MGAFEKLLLIGAVIFIAGYMGYLGPSVEKSTHEIVSKIVEGNSQSSSTVQIISPEPTQPIKIDAQYTGSVILPIDIRMKVKPGDIITISFEKMLNSQIGLTNWKLRGVSNFHLWVSQKTLNEAKKYGIKIDYYLSGNTRIGFKVVAPEKYPDNQTPTIEFIGAIGFYVKGVDLKNLITGGKSESKLAFVVRDINTDDVIKVPVFVVEGSVQGIMSDKDTDIQTWLNKEQMVLLTQLNNDGW